MRSIALRDKESILRGVLVLTLWVFLLVFPGKVAHAQTSITSSGLGTNVSKSGTTTTITGGTRPNNGGNLFHSFGNFSVGTGETADFSNNTGLPTTNIISRVTGGNVSNIFGTLKTTNFGNAALWLINPAGIVFGPTASLNVGGAVHFSTADYLRFGSGSEVFYADLGKTSTLSSAPVSAFGFLKANGSITVQGTDLSPALLPTSKTDLSLVGGDITITGRTIATNGGQVNLTSLASAGEVSMPSGHPPVISGSPSFGNITLSQARINTSGDSAGAIFLRAGQFVMEGFSSIGGETNNESGGNIQLTAETLSANSSFIFSSTNGNGSAGDINLNVGYVHLQNGSRIDNNSNGPGSGGDIQLSVGTLQLDGSVITADSFNIAGTTGSITIQGVQGPGSAAQQVVLNGSNINPSGISSSPPLSRGVTVSADTIELNDLASINSGDTLNIFATKSLRLTQSSSLASSKNLVVTAPEITLSESGISTASFTEANAGNITLTGNNIRLQSTSSVTSDTFASGNAGTILIRGRESVSIGGMDAFGNGSRIQSNSGGVFSDSSVTGAAGSITVEAPAITLSDHGSISASSLNGSSGSAGNIMLSGTTVRIESGSSISTSGSTNAGTVLIKGTESVSIGGKDALGNASTIQANSGFDPFSSSAAGSITVDAPSITLLDHASLSANNVVGGGNAGNIVLKGDQVTIAGGTQVTSSGSGSALGGTIAVDAAHIGVTDGAVLSVATESVSAGVIRLTAQNGIDIRGSRILANSIMENGGQIALTGQTVFLDVDSVANALGPLGTNGSVQINAPVQTIQGLVLPEIVPPGPLVQGITASGLNTQISAPTIVSDGHARIDITGGTRPGNGPNLFHSFGDFSVGSTEVANFLNETNLPTTNILSRVTGGNPSNIFGTIQTTGFGNANLYLINPAGVLFGQSARLNVGGAINVSTAEYLRLADEARFTALPSSTDAILSTASVATYGYLAPPTTGISIHGSEFSPSLLPSASTDLSLVGGHISITGRTLSTSGGNVNMISLASEGEVALTPGQSPVISGSPSFGTIALLQTQVDTRSDTSPAGKIQMMGETVRLTSSSILSGSLDGRAGDIHFNVGTLQLDNAHISSQSFGSGAAGNITIEGLQGPDSAAHQINLNFSNIGTSAFSEANPGSITVTADSVTLNNFSSIFANGPLSISATQSVNLAQSNLGSGKDINMTAPDIRLKGSGMTTSVSGHRNAGNITLEGSTITLTDESSIDASHFDGSGQGGKIFITGGTIQVQNASQIMSNTFGSGDAGAVTVRGTESVSVSGSSFDPSNFTFKSSSLRSDSVSNPFFVAPASGAAGNITVEAPVIHLADGASISASSVNAASGHAGDILLKGGSIQVESGAQIVSNTSGSGNAGSVTVHASESVSIGGSDPLAFSASSLRSDSVSDSSFAAPVTGAAGNITVESPQVTISESGSISANNIGGFGGGSGHVRIDTGKFEVRNGSLSATSDSSASGGKIEVTSGSDILLTNGLILTSATMAQAGEIHLTAQNAVSVVSADNGAIIGGSRLLANASSQFGVVDARARGGHVNISGHSLFIDSNTIVDASGGPLGVDGSVTIQAPTQSIEGVVLPSAPQPPGQGITSSGLNTQISAPVTLDDGHTLIDIRGGTRPGNGPNLFHSFGDFSVGRTEIANFVNDMNLPTTNIISRVTGGNPSNIFGRIQTTDFGSANFYLINPAGVLFGPAAQLNVAGSINISSADYIRFDNDRRFSALPSSSDGLLSIAPISAFGYLSAPRAGLTIQGADYSPSLLPLSHTDLTLVGGGIFIIGRTIASNGGNINLTSIASAGEVSAATSAQPPNISGVTAFGTISLSLNESPRSLTALDTSGDVPGIINIRGGHFSADTSTMTGRGRLNVTADTATMVSSTMQAEEVVLNVDSLQIAGGRSGGSAIHGSSVTIEGLAGQNSVAKQVALDNSFITSGANGVAIAANTIAITGSHIGSEGNVNLSGNNSIMLSETNDIFLGSTITASGNTTITGGTVLIEGGSHIDGAGNVVVRGTKSVSIDGRGSIVGSTRGNITIEAPGVTLLNGGTVTTNGVFPTSDGRPGDISISGDQIQLIDGAKVLARSNGSDNAGNIQVMAGSNILMRDASISVSSTTGTAGNIQVTAPKIDVVSSEVVAKSTTGNGGTLGITAHEVLVDGNSVLDASAASPALDGLVTIQAPIQNIHGLVLPAGPPPTPGQGITSSGLNTQIGAPVILDDGQVLIDIRGGTRPGDGPNLFHSFGDFSVGRSEIANFLNDMNLPTTNIISRVTGNNPSNIFGTIQTTGFGNANFYLINPAGMVFGPTAQLNVGGAINLSTANYLTFADGGRFNAFPGPADASLSMAAVSAFGYLGNTGEINILRTMDSPPLFGSQNELFIVGGDITIMGRLFPDTGPFDHPEANITLLSTASRGVINFLDGRLIPTGFTQFGNIIAARGRIAAAADLFVTANNLNIREDFSARSIIVNANSVDIQNAALGTTPSFDSLGIIIKGLDNLSADTIRLNNSTLHGKSIILNGGSVTSVGSAFDVTLLNDPASGDIQIKADHFVAKGSSFFAVGVDAGGGQITVEATSDLVLNETTISTHSGAQGGGSGGAITLKSPQVTLLDAELTSTVTNGGVGGPISIQAESALISKSKITSGSDDFGGANGGKINIGGLEAEGTAARTIILEGSSIEAKVVNGEGGSIGLQANSQIFLENSTISSDGGSGVGGFIQLIAPTVQLKRSAVVSTAEQQGGTITFNGQALILKDGTRVSSDITGSGSAGNISFNADTIRSNVNGDGTPITGASKVEISSQSVTAGDHGGQAGSITFSGRNMSDAANLIDFYNTSVSTNIVGGVTTTPPASISLTAQTINLADRTTVSSDTNGAASAGNISLSAAGFFSMGSSQVSSSTRSIPSQLTRADGSVVDIITSGTGNAGTISISSPLLRITGGSIVANTEAAGNAGSIVVQGDSLSLRNGARIASLSSETATGNAGSVTLGVSGLFSSQGSTLSSAAQHGTGGNVSITAGNMQLTGGSTVSALSTGTKEAGSIALTSASDILLQDSTVTTFAAQASGGNIKLTAPGTVRLDHSTITSSVNGPTGSNGGNISIDPEFVILQNGSQILAQAQGGNGGNITINAGTFMTEAGTLIDASSSLGISGTINIQSPIQQLSGAIAPLPQAFANIANLYGQHCAAQKGGQFSSFVQGTRDGLPPVPGEVMGSPLTFERFGNLSSSLKASELLGVRTGLNGEMAVTGSHISGCRS